jgi:hypothetical protein
MSPSGRTRTLKTPVSPALPSGLPAAVVAVIECAEEERAEMVELMKEPPGGHNFGSAAVGPHDDIGGRWQSLQTDSFEKMDLLVQPEGFRGFHIVWLGKGRTGEPLGRPALIPKRITGRVVRQVEQNTGFTQAEFAAVVRVGRKSAEQRALRRRIAWRFAAGDLSTLGLARVYNCSTAAIRRLKQEGSKASA